ncbi:D-aminoacyl-tRNA deacylase [Nymphaea colorata]|nr:D-aminoacyl-tRNA deacylase [Nymphaea colorata]
MLHGSLSVLRRPHLFIKQATPFSRLPSFFLPRAALCRTPQSAIVGDLARTDREKYRKMVVLVVATTEDPASIGPASAFLAMSSEWRPGPSLQEDIKSHVHGHVRLLIQDASIVSEDHLDKRWQALTGEVVEEVMFLSKHTAVSNKPALTVHPIGVPHLREDETPLQGGRPGWAAPPNPRVGPWLRLLKKIANSHNLIPEFEVTLEGTHHGPEIDIPTLFVEIGSTEEYWRRQDAAQVVALLLWQGLGLDSGGGDGIGKWNGNSEKNKVLLGLGGGHYAPRHLDVVVKDGVWVGHLLSGYSLPMEDPKSNNGGQNGIGGTWKQAIRVAYEATKSAFPGGVILAHLDHKSFKSWQKNAIISFLNEQNIGIGKPDDFI